MIRIVVHLALHFLVPAAVARWLYPKKWITAWLIMLATMIVDLDHLWANPIFDPNRCSLGFHPLHSYPALAVYVVLTAIPQTRLIGLGLVIHLALDGLDCLWMKYL